MNYLRLMILSGLVCGGALSACSPDKPWLMERATINDKPLELVESRHIVKTPLEAMNADTVAETAHVYQNKGAGPMYVVIAYKDHGKVGDGAIAAKKAEIENELAAQGIAAKDIVSSTVPLETPEPVALIAFDTLEARGPSSCKNEVVPGLDANAEEENMYPYQTGCAVKDYMARQIATPTDLEGHAGLGGRNDGSRLADVVSGQYRPGVAPRPFLPSYVLSELAAQ